MQHIETISLQSFSGGRRSTPELRASVQMAEAFESLPQEVDRYDLLILGKRAGKGAGFTSAMIELLDYYMAFTRECDWEEGARPIVYQSVSKTALDFSVSERQIQKTEQALFKAGAITWNDSGNHRRYGQRNAKTGRIEYAFGVDLTPLAYLKKTLEQKLQEKEAHDQAWMTAKRKISWYRAQLRALIEEGQRAGLEEIAARAQVTYGSIDRTIRAYMPLEALHALCAEHKACHDELQEALKAATPKASTSDQKTPVDEQKFVRFYSTTQESLDKSNTGSSENNCFRESVTPPEADQSGHTAPGERKDEERAGGAARDNVITATGLQHITLKQALNAASGRFREHLPLNSAALSWSDMAEAAWKLRPELHISQQNWAEACQLLGRTGATVCLILTDQAVQRERDRVMKPGAYFRAMINKARVGDLHLHKSIFGILKREEAA